MLYFYVHETHSRQEEINRRDRGGGGGGGGLGALILVTKDMRVGMRGVVSLG